jgi:hypothetical protein
MDHSIANSALADNLVHSFGYVEELQAIAGNPIDNPIEDLIAALNGL